MPTLSDRRHCRRNSPISSKGVPDARELSRDVLQCPEHRRECVCVARRHDRRHRSIDRSDSTTTTTPTTNSSPSPRTKSGHEQYRHVMRSVLQQFGGIDRRRVFRRRCGLGEHGGRRHTDVPAAEPLLARFRSSRPTNYAFQALAAHGMSPRVFADVMRKLQQEYPDDDVGELRLDPSAQRRTHRARRSGGRCVREEKTLTQPSACSSSGMILNRSPTRPKSATSKIGASPSLLIATIVPASLMPVRCWIAPEMPIAM